MTLQQIFYIYFQFFCIVASCYLISIVQKKKKLKQLVNQQPEFSDL